MNQIVSGIQMVKILMRAFDMKFVVHVGFDMDTLFEGWDVGEIPAMMKSEFPCKVVGGLITGNRTEFTLQLVDKDGNPSPRSLVLADKDGKITVGFDALESVTYNRNGKWVTYSNR